jgi:SH3-like domain-containing protein
MRFITATGIVAALSVLVFSPAKAAATQYVQIAEPFVNVYEQLDPKSNVLKMVKKGDRLELDFAGDKWYKVKVGDQIGWVERTAGNVVEGSNSFSTVLSIVLIGILLAATIYVVTVYIKKQKMA